VFSCGAGLFHGKGNGKEGNPLRTILVRNFGEQRRFTGEQQIYKSPWFTLRAGPRILLYQQL
jgi:hypothetical protein